MLRQWFASNDALPAIWIEDTSITYQGLWQKIQELSFYFTQQGIKAGDRATFVAETSIHSITTFFALLEIGASPCLLSTRLPQQKIQDYLEAAKSSFFLDIKTSSIEQCKIDPVPQDQSILLFTSGSSGSPKLASLKVEHFAASAQSSIKALSLTSEGCFLLAVPLFHVSGLSILFRCLLSGSSIALTSDLLSGHPFVSHVSLVPTQLLRVLEKTSFKGSFFPHLKCALIGGAPISENLIQKALEKAIPLYLTYGMTEMASQITMTSQSDSFLSLHLGKPLPDKELSFASDGEILVKGSSLFNGYDTPLGPQKKLLEGGWFATGDLGALDEDGNLRYKGRKDNLFISGGENIYPEPIEEALGTIAGVLQTLVIPLDDLEFGKRPVAFVHMAGPMLSKEEFQERLTSLLPKFCIPIHFLPFPREILEKSFKVARSELREILLQKT